jgi:hypothetical protein
MVCPGTGARALATAFGATKAVWYGPRHRRATIPTRIVAFATSAQDMDLSLDVSPSSEKLTGGSERHAEGRAESTTVGARVSR